MKNMKISAKLITSFLIMLVLANIVGLVGILGMTEISSADTRLYEENLIAVQTLGEIQYNITALRVHNRNIVIYPAASATFQNSDRAVTEIMDAMPALFDTYQATISDPGNQAAFDQFKNLYNNILIEQVVKPSIEAGRLNQSQKAQDILDLAASQVEDMNDFLLEIVQYNADLAEYSVYQNMSLSNSMTKLMIGVLIAAILVAVALGVYISRLISKPTKALSDMMNNLVQTGDFHLDTAELNKIDTFGKSRDETGVTASAFGALMKMILAKCDVLDNIADGDLTVTVEHISDHDTIGNAMQKMVNSLNKLFAEINSSSRQVSTGSVQIATGAQMLAQGSTQQSATVEELSASLARVAEQTKSNADTAAEAKDLAENIKISAQQGTHQMEQMIQAVTEIDASSKSIGKVIKIIDDIAFQTNILALNAAVEAARAGQHGKGFAVVADEVRSLAAKSAEAANNTNDLIESSIQKAEQGAAISSETAQSLNQIVDGILKSSELVSSIALSSNEQSLAIDQIGKAIDQVSKVVYQNNATAEESAAASQEMSAQAAMLQQLISQFRIIDSGNLISGIQAPAERKNLISGSTGKY